MTACTDFPNVVAQRHILGVRTQGLWSLRCWTSPRRKIAYSITQSPSLFDAPGTEAFASE